MSCQVVDIELVFLPLKKIKVLEWEHYGIRMNDPVKTCALSLRAVLLHSLHPSTDAWRLSSFGEGSVCLRAAREGGT